MYRRLTLPIALCILILMSSCAVPIQKNLVPEAEAKSLVVKARNFLAAHELVSAVTIVIG